MTTLNIDVEHIRSLNIDNLKARMVNKRESDRITDKHEGSYRLLVWLAHQFDGVNIVDIGTRRGSSAICLADNPNNTVTTYDITFDFRGQDVAKMIKKKVTNVKCILSDVSKISDSVLLAAPIIYLDISHDGYTEQKFLNHLKEIKYSGLLFMDDINFAHKFPMLKIVFDTFEAEKYHIPRPIAHDTGTGLIVYGQHNVSIVLPPTKSKR